MAFLLILHHFITNTGCKTCITMCANNQMLKCRKIRVLGDYLADIAKPSECHTGRCQLCKEEEKGLSQVCCLVLFCHAFFARLRLFPLMGAYAENGRRVLSILPVPDCMVI